MVFFFSSLEEKWRLACSWFFFFLFCFCAAVFPVNFCLNICIIGDSELLNYSCVLFCESQEALFSFSTCCSGEGDFTGWKIPGIHSFTFSLRLNKFKLMFHFPTFQHGLQTKLPSLKAFFFEFRLLMDFNHHYKLYRIWRILWKNYFTNITCRNNTNNSHWNCGEDIFKE